MAPVRRGQERLARLTVLVYFLSSVLTLASWPLGRFTSGQSWVETVGDVLNLPLAYGLFGAVLLFLLTGALLRRKRFAVWIVIVLQLIGVALALVLTAQSVWGHRPPPRGVEANLGSQLSIYAGGLFGALAAIGLVWARPAFPARRSPGSRWATLLTLAAGMGISILLAIVLAASFGGSLAHPLTPVVQGVRAALGLDGLTGRPAGMRHLPGWITWLASTVSAVVVLAAVAVFLRSGQDRQTPDARTELAIRKLLLNGHDDSLGYFGTRRDKKVLFGPDGRAAITYRVIASVALASADPVGDKDAWPARSTRGWVRPAHTGGFQRCCRPARKRRRPMSTPACERSRWGTRRSSTQHRSVSPDRR